MLGGSPAASTNNDDLTFSDVNDLINATGTQGRFYYTKEGYDVGTYSTTIGVTADIPDTSPDTQITMVELNAHVTLNDVEGLDSYNISY